MPRQRSDLTAQLGPADFAPLTALAGPLWSYNLLAIAAPALTAWTAYLLCRHLTRDTPLLRYATEASMPVYVLHQTLIVYAVYHLAHVNWPLGVKIVLTLSFCVMGSLALYEAAIRRNRWLRLLFGVKDRAADIGLDDLT